MDIRRFKISLIITCMLVMSCVPAYAKSALDLGIAGVGARVLAMGKANVAVADDANAVFTNPAGLAIQNNWSATCMSSKLMDRVDYKLLAGTYQTQYGTFGLGYISASTPGGYLTTDKTSLNSATPISYGSSQLVLSFGRNINEIIKVSNSLGDLSVGVNAKLFTDNFTGTNGSAFGTSYDLGFLLKPKPDLSLGLNLQNLAGNLKWSNGSNEDIESKTRLGAAYKLLDGKLLLAVDADLAIGREVPLLLHTGAEWRPQELIVVRAGFDQDPLSASATTTNLTGGLGFKLAGFSFDYAYQQDSKLAGNASHYFSFSYQPEEVKTTALSQDKGYEDVTEKVKSEPLKQTKANKDLGILSYYK